MPTSRMALITFLDGQGNVPDNSLPGVPARPDNSLPGYGGGRPDNSLPGMPPGIATLPVFPFDPTVDNELPGSGGGGGSTLPVIRPGLKFVVKWLACVGLILVPDNSLPGSGARPDQGLPPSPGRPDAGLPPFQGRPDTGLPPSPGHPDAGLPPTEATPKLYGG